MAHRSPALSRRKMLTLSVATMAAAALAACGGNAPPTAPTIIPPSPTNPPPTPATPAITTAPTSPTPAPPVRVATPTVAPTRVATPTVAPTRNIGTVTGIVTVPSPLGPGHLINAQQYGAVGDGTTDDTAAIQAAINAVPASGGTVQFPPGTYIVAPGKTTGIAIKSNVNLTGSGANSVLKIKDHLGDWQRLLSPKNLGDTIENFAVTDLSFDSNIVNNPESLIKEQEDATYQTFVHIASGRNLHVQRCRFAPYSGVWAVSFNGQGVRDCSVTDSYFQFVMRDGNPDYDNSAVYIEGTNYIFSGNRFESTPHPYHEARACMEAHGGPAEVMGNTSSGFQTTLNIVGSYFAGGNSRDILCHDNIATDALIGIMLWATKPNGLTNVTVTNNTIVVAQLKHGTADTGGVSVVFSPEAIGLASDIMITGNRIRFQDEGAGRAGDFYYNSAGIGLHNLGGVAACRIEGNTIDLAPSGGILVGNSEPGQRLFRDVRIANNTILNAGQNLGFPAEFRAGILVNSSAANLEIIANTITDTFAIPRCPAAIAFDRAAGNAYSGITVTDNISKARNGPLPMWLPSGAAH